MSRIPRWQLDLWYYLKYFQETLVGTNGFFNFENVSKVNGWDDTASLQWLKVRLTGRAQSAIQRLPSEITGDYKRLKSALQERFEPNSRKERYQAQFQARKKKKDEDWADFAEDLKSLVDKAYPGFSEEAKEELALNRYTSQIDNPQVAFNVRQRRPKSLDEAVSATLEIESFLPHNLTAVHQVGLEEEPSKLDQQKNEAGEGFDDQLIGAISTSNDLMSQMLLRLQKLEEQMAVTKAPQTHRRDRVPFNRSSGRNRSTNVECWNCGEKGHFAQMCRLNRQGNEDLPGR